MYLEDVTQTRHCNCSGGLLTSTRRGWLAVLGDTYGGPNSAVTVIAHNAQGTVVVDDGTCDIYGKPGSKDEKWRYIKLIGATAGVYYNNLCRI